MKCTFIALGLLLVVSAGQSVHATTYRCPPGQLAFTFDDGPHPKHTPQVLDVLQKAGIKGTFYLLGEKVKAHPELVQRIHREGHEIGIHGWDHQRMDKLSGGATAVEKQLRDTWDAILKALGNTRNPAVIKTMRPPYGKTGRQLVPKVAGKLYLEAVNWSFSPQDWQYIGEGTLDSQPADVAVGKVNAATTQMLADIDWRLKHMNPVKRGEIILQHDTLPQTPGVLANLIERIQSKQFRIVTVSQCLADNPSKANLQSERLVDKLEIGYRHVKNATRNLVASVRKSR
ncbi:hypothetical protein H4R33_000264 [Dimargaris cristalligena]|uniref:NodB homology domain-containing protein n=1 Tax=Dimargaris cristalligena TaxID=215637 RepID=A0A4P9ZXJ9_9FUNG|nr:hypothetical protein H4R33_000264 [Dimargaris cristalligena]RKP38383.1 hypothetical protein BJ085DRAFT_19168 [Dimargaris cristalligena]|eukprot:RKP38383.1 hypothetical protein BJ085DRAFT_19168 [Dimargaris cristalligena]